MHVALILFQKRTNLSALLTELKLCGNSKNLARGRRIHEEVIRDGYDSHVLIANTLISMYGKCGSLPEALKVFEKMEARVVVSWNALISGYAENGEGEQALDLFSRMRNEGYAANGHTYLAALKACNAVDKDERRVWGRTLHLLASCSGCDTETCIENTLVDMYAKFRTMVDARRVFDSIRQPNVISWNALIFGYADNGEGEVALELFDKIGCAPDTRTFVAALKACTDISLREGEESRERGMAVHLLASCNDCDSGVFVSSTLLNMYVKCRSIDNARRVFDDMTPPNLVSYNALMLGYADNGEDMKALDLFSRMGREGYKPNARTFTASLKACSNLAGKNAMGHKGMVIHLLALRSGDMDMYVESTLVDIYAKCGMMDEARMVFDNMKQPDVVSWTTLILGYADNGKGETALDMFTRMERECDALDARVYVGAIRAVTALGNSGNERGKALHLLATRCGGDSSMYVKSVLVDMYVKFGNTKDAHKMFDTLTKPDVVSWTSLILGYVDNGEGAIALELFTRMKREGCAVDSGIFSAVLKACAITGDLEFGKAVHVDICNRGIQIDRVLATCLVDFYAKCGSLLEAEQIFNLHDTNLDIIAWTALLTGYSRLGDTPAVFGLFKRMLDSGLRPDAVTFSCILTACSHAGLVVNGIHHFQSMTAKYGIKPDAEHYTCMVDILGRANNLDDAMVLLRSMSFNPDTVTWIALLGACRKWKNVRLGRLVFEAVTSLNDSIPGVYVQMGNLYGKGQH